MQLKAEAEGETSDKRGMNNRLIKHLLDRIEDEDDTLSMIQND